MQQHNLFDDLAHIRARRKAGVQVAHARAAQVVNAVKRGETAMQRCADRNEHVNAGWCQLALDKLRDFASKAPGEWTMEDARTVFAADIPAPTDLRAYGVVTRNALRQGLIVKTGRSAPTASSNGSGKPTFRKGPQA